MCRNDSKCDGVECGENYKCYWWGLGICGNTEKQFKETRTMNRTCMKTDEGAK